MSVVKGGGLDVLGWFDQDLVDFASGEPVASSDSFALTEAQSVAVTESKAGSDAFAVTEARAIDITSARTDSAALSEAATLAVSVSGADSASFTEAQSLAVTEFRAGSDTFVFSEQSSQTSIDAKASSDAFALSEANTLERQSSVADAFTFAEARSIAAALTAIDSGTLSEAELLAFLDSKSSSDAFSLSESTPLLSALLAQLDSGTFSEALAASVAVAATDLATLTEFSVSGQEENVASSDGFVFIENKANIPTAHYPLDETSGTNAEDTVGNNDGTRNGGVLDSTFDGSNDYIALPNGNIFGLAAVGPWTMEATITLAADIGTNIWALGHGNTPVGSQALLGIATGATNAGQIRAVFRGDSGGVTSSVATSGYDYRDGQPHRVRVTMTAARLMSLYVDDKFVGSTTVNSVPITIARNTIGALTRDTTTLFWKGSIDDVTYYNSIPVPLTEQTNLVNSTDTFVLSEASAIAAALSGSETFSLSEAVATAQVQLKTGIDAGVLSEDAALFINFGADYTHSLPPQVILGSYRAEMDVADAVAIGLNPGHAAIVIGAHKAEVVVFTRQADGIVLDPDDAMLAEYQADGTLR